MSMEESVRQHLDEIEAAQERGEYELECWVDMCGAELQGALRKLVEVDERAASEALGAVLAMVPGRVVTAALAQMASRIKGGL